MELFTERFLQEMEDILNRCNTILEEKYPRNELNEMKCYVETFQKQLNDYQKNLKEQESNSKLELSRNFASIFLKEDREMTSNLKFKNIDENALYVEYLTGRARIALVEALMGAISLKLLAEETNN